MSNPALRIRELIAEIETLLANLPKELEELRVAERVLKRFDPSEEVDAKSPQPMKAREIFIQVLKESESA